MVTQQYAPDSLASRTYYEPSRHGAEARYAERSERIKAILGRDPGQPGQAGRTEPGGLSPDGQGRRTGRARTGRAHGRARGADGPGQDGS